MKLNFGIEALRLNNNQWLEGLLKTGYSHKNK